jgi:hypothetical protein
MKIPKRRKPGSLDAATLRLMYIRRARVNFDSDIDLQEKTRIHDLSIKLGISIKEVEEIWYENDLPDFD